MRSSPARSKAAVAAFVIAAQLALWASPLVATVQAAPKNPVQRGQEYYEQSRFDDAIAYLNDLIVRGGLSTEDLLTAREFLARSYVKRGLSDQGKNAFKGILRDTPSWRPDAVRVPPDETAVFEQALKEFQDEQKAQPPAPPQSQPPPATPPIKAPPSTPATNGMEPGGKKKLPWLWIGLGVVAVGGIAAAAGGGGGGGDKPPPASPLPPFPPPP